MIDMDFHTDQPHCEIFLAAEDLGFLMLSADGKIYRKWQGLTIGELSVFADLEWRLKSNESTDTEPPLLEALWYGTSRTTDTVTRSFRLNCGCHIKETWHWPKNATQLDVCWSWVGAKTCHTVHEKERLRITPLWTLCPTGHASSGGAGAQIIHGPHSKNSLQVQSELAGVELIVTGLTEKGRPPAEWVVVPSIHHNEVPTPHDAHRGENSNRTVLLTHFSELSLAPGKSATISISFLMNQNRPSRPSAPSATPNASQFESPFDGLQWQNAFANAQASLEQLVRRRADGTLGLMAGLPWFTQFWTRDLCHSFRAAFLWSGRSAEGEKIISELWQASGEVIPNYTTTTATTTNSADALPLLLLSSADLVDVIGLSKELSNQLTQIRAHLLRGAEILSLGELFRHGPADTWMDAQKQMPDGHLIACSPRADRAIEIQCFWIAALSRWAEFLSETRFAEDAPSIKSSVEVGLKNLRRLFFNSEKRRWADHIRPDDTQDLSLRPNLLLGLAALHRAELLHRLLENHELAALMDDLIQADLIVPYGVRTLSPETPVRHPQPINEIFADQSDFIYENKIHFHPYHEFGTRHGLEHPDWAYHNGTIWPWLSAPATQILQLAQGQKIALQLTQTLVWHAVHGTQGGAIAELLDGLSSHSPWSWPKGAPHQAWSEAALIQMICENWLGLRIRRASKELSIDTGSWNIIGSFSISFAAAQGQIQVKYESTQSILTINSTSALTVKIDSPNRTPMDRSSWTLSPASPLVINLTHI